MNFISINFPLYRTPLNLLCYLHFASEKTEVKGVKFALNFIVASTIGL